LAAKEQISICNSVVDEELTYQFLAKKEKHLQRLTNHLQTNYTILKAWLHKQKHLQYVLPDGGAVCFPKIKAEIDYDKFYSVLNTKYGTYVGPGHWFEMDKSYMRIGFGWPSSEELIEGLSSIDAVLKEI
jgi:DNA-binding transcriptional MocR family regulator